MILVCLKLNGISEDLETALSPNGEEKRILREIWGREEGAEVISSVRLATKETASGEYLLVAADGKSEDAKISIVGAPIGLNSPARVKFEIENSGSFSISIGEELLVSLDSTDAENFLTDMAGILSTLKRLNPTIGHLPFEVPEENESPDEKDEENT